jgi:hypothetical protein
VLSNRNSISSIKNKKYIRKIKEYERSLFRMNFIIQDNTAMTLETNLVKIIEEILYDEKGG